MNIHIYLCISIIIFSYPAAAQVQKSDSLPDVHLLEVVVSALRLPYKESSIPYSVSTIKPRSNTQGLSLSEDLAGLSGIEVNARYNFAVGDRITNRGFGARTQFGVRGVRILLDDVPVTFADGQSNLEMIDIQNLSNIELLKGPGSSLYGNASGGVLLLHSIPIRPDQFLSSVSTTLGSNGLSRWNGSVEGSMGETLVSANFARFHYNGFRNHASADFNRAIVKLDSHLSPSDVLQAQAGYVRFNALNPGSLTKQEETQDPKLANPASITNAAGQDGDQAQLSAIWKHQIDSNSLLKLTVYGIHRSIVNPIIGKIVVLPQNSGGMDAMYNSKITVFRETFNWTAGAELAFRFNNRKNFTNNNGQEGNLILNQLEQVIGTGVYLQVLAPVSSKMDVDASIRYDRSYFEVTDHLINPLNTNNSGNRNMNGVNPSFGIVYRLLNTLNCFANLSTSFETPTSTELANSPDGTGGFNPDLNPSHALGFESGFRGTILSVIHFDLTGYIINTRDDLIPFQVPSAPGQDYYRNAGSTVHRGGELTVRYVPFSFFEVLTSLTYIDAYYKNFIVKGADYSGNNIPGITPVRGVAELKLHNRNGSYCSMLMQSFGKVYADDANAASTDPYTILDLGIGHEGISFGDKWIKKIIFSCGISNIFNRQYTTAVTVNAAANRYYEPAPGRSFYINTRFEFGKP